MGFDKIRKKQSRLEDIKFVILDGMRIAWARDGGEGRIAETCPSVAQLNLSRSLWESMAGVVEVCGDLQNLRKLALRYEISQIMKGWNLTCVTVATVSEISPQIPWKVLTKLLKGSLSWLWKTRSSSGMTSVRLQALVPP